MDERAKEQRLLKITGLGYFPIAFVARIPYAMMVVGVLTLVVTVRGSIGLAGVTSALVGIGTATVGPVLGSLADRHGQRRILLIVGACNAVALLGVTALAFWTTSDWGLWAAAFLVGATAPQVSPMSRSRLVEIIRTQLPGHRLTKTMATVMSYESAADETVFIFGPVLVGLFATLFSPAAPLIIAAGLTLVFVTAFALHPSAGVVRANTPSETAGAQAPVRALFNAPLVLAVAGTLGVGIYFGSTLTSLTSFLEGFGKADSAGLLYGVMGVGSTILALSVMLFPARFTLRARWVSFGAVMLGASLIYGSAAGVPQIVIALLLAGIGIGPTLVTLYSLAAELTPVGRGATVMTMMGSGIIVGQALASAVTGLIAQNVGAGAAMWVPAFAAGLVFVAGVASAALGGRRQVS